MKNFKPKWNIWFLLLKRAEWSPLIYRSKLNWKDKFETPRIETIPSFCFAWLWFSFGLQKGTEDIWEKWIWIEKYHNGDVEKAKANWGWIDYDTKLTTW